MPSKNFKSLVPNVVCLCILVLGCILFIYLCLELNAYTRFQEGSAEICQIIEIPPFIEPQSGAQQCCYIDIDPLVLNVSVLETRLLAFPDQSPLCVCNLETYHSYVDKYKVGFNYSCRVEELADYQVFLASEYKLDWIVPATSVVMGIPCLWFTVIGLIKIGRSNIKKFKELRAKIKLKRHIERLTPTQNEGDF